MKLSLSGQACIQGRSSHAGMPGLPRQLLSQTSPEERFSEQINLSAVHDKLHHSLLALSFSISLSLFIHRPKSRLNIRSSDQIRRAPVRDREKPETKPECNAPGNLFRESNRVQRGLKKQGKATGKGPRNDWLWQGVQGVGSALGAKGRLGKQSTSGAGDVLERAH